MRRPGLDQAEVEAALAEAAWLSIHGTREDKDGIFRGPQLVLPDLERIKRRARTPAQAAQNETSEQTGLAEPPQPPYPPGEK